MKNLFLIFFIVQVQAQVLNRQAFVSQSSGVTTNKGFMFYQTIGQQSPQGSSIKSGFIVQQGFQQFSTSFFSSLNETLTTKIFPNPFLSELNVEFSEKIGTDILVTISDMSGKMISVNKAIFNGIFFTVDQLDWIVPGAYIVSIQSGNHKSSTIILKK